MQLTTIFVLAPMLAHLAPAQARDSGVRRDAGGADCGVSPQGQCNGTVLTTCNANGQAEMIDCAMNAPGAICTPISAAAGNDCQYPPGAACLLVDDMGSVYNAFCQGTRAGCVAVAEGTRCVENVGPCTAADEETCTGNRLLHTCSEGQPLIVDCAAFGGACSNGACANLGRGAPCDDILACVPGVGCTDNYCGGPPADAGRPDSGGAGSDGGPSGSDAGAGDSGTVPSRDGGAATDAASSANTSPKTGCGCGVSAADPSAKRRSSVLALGLALALVYRLRRLTRAVLR